MDAHYNTSLGRYEPVFGALNGERLPDYFSLDLRVDRRIARIAEAALFAYVDAHNVTFAEHAEEVAYSADYTERHYLTGLPPVVIAGFRVER